MERALLAERHVLWARSCPELSDIDFIRLGLLRCISTVDSGRHFLQTNEEIYGQLLPHSTYFKSLKSQRRTEMLETFEQQSYQLHCETLLSQGIDYLNVFPELDDYSVEAVDGHFIDHASHTEKNNTGKVYAAGGIYALNLRNGLLRFLCLVTNGTQKHQEIPRLRDHIEKKNKGNDSPQKHLCVYDKAVTDYGWWDQQKQHSNYMISMLYFKRWTIEKSFNNTKSNFKETKAWSSNTCSLKNQMRLTAMSYNLMRVFEEGSKMQQPELIHPSDKKYNEALEKRQHLAQK